MKLITLPAPYPTFNSYMKQFGKNLVYSIPAIVLVLAVDFMVNDAIRRSVGTFADNLFYTSN
mgnify:CR=1 FL=1